MENKRPEIVVPEQAAKRGRILRGELRSADTRILGVLAQFSKIAPSNKKAKIFFYPTLEQAKTLQLARPPFSFEGTVMLRDRVQAHYRATEIWPKYGSEISSYEILCFTQCSGRLADLRVTIASQAKREKSTSGGAWFLANECFLVQLLATPDEDYSRQLKELKLARPVHRFQISDGATAEFARIASQHSFKANKKIRNRDYAIQVDGAKDAATAEKDIECLLILASLASRERSEFWFRSVQESPQMRSEVWRFGMGEFSKRPDGEEPLLVRDSEHCSKFLSVAYKAYMSSSNGLLLDSAVYALLSRDLALETRIVNLVSGVQRALLFALPKSNKQAWQKIEPLYRKFERRYVIDLSDLWPLFDGRSGVSLYAIRNALVHGGVFTDNKDFIALSVAAENLKWILERILLVALGWDIELSSVSPKKLLWNTAHNWKEEQRHLAILLRSRKTKGPTNTP
jgi:hypothetical protein